jgi:hypothetical protein
VAFQESGGEAVGDDDELFGVSAELQKLSDLLADDDLRRAFYLDPDDTMAEAGVDTSVIPAGLLDTLKGLSHLELGVVSRTNTKLRGRLKDDELRLIIMFPV